MVTQAQSTVYLFREQDRYRTVRKAASAVLSSLDWSSYHRILIKPNLVSTTNLLADTHPDALAAVLDEVREHTNASILVAEGTATQNTWVAFHRFGYVDLVRRYFDVRLFDLNTDEGVPLQAFDRHLRPMFLRAARAVLDADLVISVGPPKTHDFVIVTLSIKNTIMGTLISRYALEPPSPDVLHGHEDARPLGVRVLRAARRAYDLMPAWMQRLPVLEAPRFRFMAQSPHSDKMRMHQSYPILHLNLFMMADQGLRPHVSIIDGWEAMEGDGPTDGIPVPWRMAAASVDALAADALVADLMGYPLQEVGYLYYCHLAGLGQGDVSQMRVDGNLAPEDLRRPFRPHRLIANQRRWRDERVMGIVQARVEERNRNAGRGHPQSQRTD